MGQDESQTLSYSSKGLEELPPDFVVPKGFTYLDLSNNCIKKLPQDLPIEGLSLRVNRIKTELDSLTSQLKSYPLLKKLDISYNLITKINNDFKEITTLTDIDLSGNKITSLQDITIEGLIFLNLSSNKLRTFPLLPSTLKTFKMSSNYVTSLNLSHPNLTELHLSQNEIKTIPENALFPLLRKLDLSKNNIQELPDISKIAPLLENINVSDNFIKEIPNLPKSIRVISFKYNEISEIPNHLTSLPYLTTLNLSFNHIQKLPKLPPTVVSLFCNNNEIKTVEPSNLPNLELVNFCFNEFEELPPYTYQKVELFFMRNNKIKTIDVNRIPLSATKIRLSNNFITEIPGAMFSPDSPLIKNLILFDLANNKLNNIPPEIVNSKLTTLIISKNPIEKIPTLPSTIEELYIGFCKLDHLEESTFSLCNKSITELFASNNKLKRIPSIPSLRILRCSRNNINIFPELPPTIQIIDLSYNCLRGIPENSVFPDLHDFDVSFNFITIFPNWIDICLDLKYIKFSYNKFKKNTTIDLTHNPKLSLIDSEGNSANVLFNSETVHQFIINPNNNKKESETASDKEYLPSAIVNVIKRHKSVGVSEMTGKRPTMEDSVFIHYGEEMSTYGIFDGHNGDVCSKFGTFFYRTLFEDEGNMSSQFLADSLNKIDAKLRSINAMGGSTVVLSLVNKNKIIISHLGDSGAILFGKNGEILYQTTDHRPDSRAEFKRIKRGGGFVADQRIDGVIAVSSSIGDFKYPGVGKTAETVEIELKGEEKWLILACDGLFDFIDNDVIREMCVKAVSPSKLAFDLRNVAYGFQGGDNISVISIDLTIHNE